MVSTVKKLMLCTFFAFGVVTPLAGCDNSAEVMTATSLSIATPSVNIRVGDRITVKYSVAPAGARNAKAYWFSSNESVVYATDGVLMGVGKGTAKVSVVVGGLKASIDVSVIDAGGGDVKSIVLSTNSMTLSAGGSAPIKAYANPSSEVVTWTSSNESVAKYENGSIVAVAAGECDITAAISDDLSDVCHVVVNNDSPGPTPGPQEGWTGSIKVGAPLGEMEWMKEILSQFNTSTGSTVTFSVTQWEEGSGPDNLPQSLGDGPDIYPYVSDQTIGFYQRNALAQLSQVNVNYIKTEMGEAADYAKLNGTTKYIGYPFASDNAYVMFYNKSLAAQAGITDMSNISMTELLSKAEAADLEVDFPINNAFYAAGSLMSYNNGESLYTLKMKSGGTSYSVSSEFASENGVKAAKEISKIFRFTKSGTLQLATEVPMNGTLATIVDCSKASSFKTYLGANYDAAPLPFIDENKDVRYSIYSGYKFYGINPGRASSHLDLANAVAKYLVSEEVQLKRFEKFNYKPTITSLLQKTEIANEPHIKALIAQGKANTIPLTAVDSSLWSQSAVAIKAIQKLGSGASDAAYKQILEELDDSLAK